MSKKYIAQTLKRLRKSSNLTADEVGSILGISGKTVNGWENNRSQPSIETLLILNDIYNVDNIFDEINENKENININLSKHEKQLILAYRSKQRLQEAVNILLNVKKDEE